MAFFYKTFRKFLARLVLVMALLALLQACGIGVRVFEGTKTGAGAGAGGGAGGSGSDTGSVIPQTAPATFSSIDGNAVIDLSWTSGGGESGFLLVRRTGSAVTWTPTDGTIYSAGALDLNHTAVYAGPATSYSDTSVVNGTTYYYALFAYSSSHVYSSSYAGSGAPYTEIAGWSDVSAAASGINKDGTKFGNNPHSVAFNSKLYSTWVESDGAIFQTRVAVYNGNDGAPGWTFVDGNAATGINRDTTKNASLANLVVFNSKLYVFWSEDTGAGNLQLRAAVYNGNDGAPSWTLVDGNLAQGLNRNVVYPATQSSTAVINSKLYVIWAEQNATAYQVRIAVYGGNDSSPTWTFVDGNGVDGINFDANRAVFWPHLGILGTKLYATWYEATAGPTQVRVAVYNGNDSSPGWSFIDGGGATGINKDVTRNAYNPQFASVNSKLYLAWSEENAGAVQQIRAVVYNGNDSSPGWTFIDGNGANGINKNTALPAGRPEPFIFHSKIYMSWNESNGGTYQIRIGTYNGDDGSPSWSMVDGNGVSGINGNPANIALQPRLAVMNSKLYCVWQENNGNNQVRVAVGQ